MAYKDKAKKELTEELNRTRRTIAELEIRQIELDQLLGCRPSVPLLSRPMIIYGNKDSGLSCVPGLFVIRVDPASAPTFLESLDESDPDFSFLKNCVHPGDFPSVEADFKAFGKGLKDTICRRLRLHFFGEMTTWVDCHVIALNRDGNQIPTEMVCFIRLVGPVGPAGPKFNQLVINLFDTFDSILQDDGPLAALIKARHEGEDDLVARKLDELLLLAGVGAAKAWSLMGAWDMSFVKDSSMRYVWVSTALSQILGLRPEEMYGKSDSGLFDSVSEVEEAETGEAVMRGAKAHFNRMRTVAGKPQLFHDSLWSLPALGDSEAGWIVGITRLGKQEAAETEELSRSPATAHAFEMARKAARFDSTVVLIGETGVGKGHLARFIHQQSRRAGAPLYTKNCAAIPKDLAESELFGHEKGAFTSATQPKRGLLELADGGTLMLDEIGKMPIEIQGKLLVFLDRKGFSRLGSTKILKPNVRLIVASNRDLEELVAEGLFLKDLYYRLNVVPIKVPPLRERFEELPGLLPELLGMVCQDLGLDERPKIGAGDIAEVKRHQWVGNIRELKNILERSLVLSGGQKLDLRKVISPLPPITDDACDTGGKERVQEGERQALAHFPEKGQSLDDILAEVSRELIEEALRRTDGNNSEAARLLGISRNRLRRVLRKPIETGTP